MNQPLKKSLFLLTLSLLLISITLSFQVPETKAWAWETHYFIDDEAESVFSDNSFFANNHATLQTWCVKPDQGWGESDWHWLDAISYHPLETTGGRLPWGLRTIFENAVKELENKNWNQAAQLMGAASHFTGDGTMPLHSTYNYDPGSNHTNYEYKVNSHLNEFSIPQYAPREIENIFDAAMKTLEESFNYTSEDPNGGVNISYFLEYDNLWNKSIREITENRVRASVKFTSDLWYTAMIRAGLTISAPNLTEPLDEEVTSDSKPTFSWSSSSGVGPYTLELRLENSAESNEFIIKNIQNTSYTLDNQLNSGNWSWRIRSGDNSTHVGLWSESQEFSVQKQINEDSGSPLLPISIGMFIIVVVVSVLVISKVNRL